MTKIEVKEAAKGKLLIEEHDLIRYKIRWDSLDAEAWYLFDNGFLYAGNIVFDDSLHECISLDNCINLFLLIYDNYTKKYGEPYDEAVFWSDSTNYPKPEMLAIAISKDQLTLAASWIFKNDEIMIFLFGENNHVRLSVLYQQITSERNKQLPLNRPDHSQIDDNLGKNENNLLIY